MDPARIAELLKPFLAAPTGASAEEADMLSDAQLRSISTYIDILLRWNARINLTAIRDPDEIVTRHFGESLFAARALFPSTRGEEHDTNSEDNDIPNASPAIRQADRLHRERGDYRGGDYRGRDHRGGEHRGRAALQGRERDQERMGASAPVAVADVGSGAGFPGIPLKLWAPEIRLTLVESNQKKSVFLREVARALTLTDIDIQTTRAEALPPSSFDVVTLRAVERFDAVLPAASALVRPHGRLALLIGQPQVSVALSGVASLGWGPPMPVPQSHSRVLLIGEKFPSVPK
jgi:16S rRNA G527 N7-methylase RsmG